MPMYQWRDTTNGRTVDVIRNFDDFELKPGRDEAEQWTDAEWQAAKWEKVIGAVSVVKGRSWGPGKGYW